MVDSRVEKIIQETVLGDIFCVEENSPEGVGAYEFFLKFECDAGSSIDDTELGTKWGFVACEEYECLNIRKLRGLMESKYKDLCRFYEKTAPFQKTNFMDYFRSDAYSEETSADDKIEVFSKSIGSGDDITVELLNQILSDYDVGDRIIVSDNNVFKLEDFSKELRDLLSDYADFSSCDIFDTALILYRDSLQTLHDDIKSDTEGEKIEVSTETHSKVEQLIKTNIQRFVFREN